MAIFRVVTTLHSLTSTFHRGSFKNIRSFHQIVSPFASYFHLNFQTAALFGGG